MSNRPNPTDPSEPRPESRAWANLEAPEGTAIAVCLGNSNAKMGLIDGLTVRHARSAPVNDPKAVAAVLGELLAMADPDHPPASALLSSVNAAATPKIEQTIRSVLGMAPLRFGPSMPVPIATEVLEPARVGQDRLLSALGAFQRSQQACIVVDAGTALTVDFVDGHGVFHGGAILPGGQLMLRALHEHTDALPSLGLSDMPDPLEPFGRSTEHAMLLGVRAAVCGAVRYLAERYAEFYEAYPHIIATGGESEILLGGDELIEAIVPNLELLGMAVARARLASDPES